MTGQDRCCPNISQSFLGTAERMAILSGKDFSFTGTPHLLIQPFFDSHFGILMPAHPNIEATEKYHSDDN